MKEHIVERVNFCYSPLEDRLQMRCFFVNDAQVLWITYRMLRRLQPALVQWLSKAGAKELLSNGFLTNAVGQAEDEIGKVANSKLAVVGRSVKHAKNVSSESYAGEPTKTHSCNVSPFVCSVVKVSSAESYIRLNFQFEEDGLVFILSMSVIEASLFVYALQSSLVNSDWLIDWPSWMTLDTHNGLEQSSISLH